MLLPFIILQTCCAAFQLRQNEPAISPTVIAENSFAGSNYLDCPLLITAFSQRKVYHTHLTRSLRKQGGRRGVEGLLLVLQSSSAIGGPAREIENNTASDHGDLLCRCPKNPILNLILLSAILSAILSAVIIRGTAVCMCRLPPREKPSGHFSSLSNPPSASVAFCRWQSVRRAAPKANKWLIL